MASTPRSHPAVQRLNKAYIQVPPSPYSTSSVHRALGTPNHVAASNKLKENTPLRPSHLAMSHSVTSSASLKRKTSECEPHLIFDGVVIPSAKKAKLSAPSDHGKLLKDKQSKPDIPVLDLINNFPNGAVYCHQCNRKRDLLATIQCTRVTQYETASGNIKERPCKFKYCKSCLKNRYDDDIDNLKAQTRNVGYHCPRCRDVCNCPRCRKAKGLEPMGALRPPKPKDASSLPNGEKKPRKKDTKTQVVVKPEAKPLPVLAWTGLPAVLTRDEAEDRIFIREFLFRFGDYIEPPLAKTHLEELEFVASKRYDPEDDSSDWVSDQCLKAIFLGLLGVLAKGHDEAVSKLLKVAMKDLRASGVNLNKMWSLLIALRDNIAKSSSSQEPTSGVEAATPLSFPDPVKLPSRAALASRSLRSLQTENEIVVAQSWQMIPIVISLIHSALRTSVIRDEIEQGGKDYKDVNRDAKEAIGLENERWEKERSTMEKGVKDKAVRSDIRVKRAVHKDQVADIENALKIVGSTFASRFMPLGTDNDGRTYYALSPGVAERGAALEYLSIAASEKLSKPKKKGCIRSIPERQALRDWSWLIAVWGKRGPLTPAEEKAKMEIKSDSDESSDEEKDGLNLEKEQWWGFWDSEHIDKLAEYISIKSGFEEDDAPLLAEPRVSSSKASSGSKPSATKGPRIGQLKRLVTDLKDYSTLLQWRTRDDKYKLAKRTVGDLEGNTNGRSRNGSGKLSTGTASVDGPDI